MTYFLPLACRHYLPPSPPKYVKPHIHIDKDLLFIICQGCSQSFIYRYEIKMDEIPMLERAPPLKPHYIVHGDDHGHRHFFGVAQNYVLSHS